MKRYLNIIIISFLICQSAFSKEAPTSSTPVLEGLCYKNVIKMIAEQNIDVNIAKEKIAVAKANYVRSFTPLLPSIRGQLSAEHFDGGEVYYFNQPIQIERNTLRPTVAFDYQISLGGKPFWDIAASKSKYKSSMKSYDSAFQKVLYDISNKYFDWLRAFANYNTAEQSLAFANKQYQLNEDRLNSGFGTKLDVLQSETQLADRKNELLDAEHALVNGETELMTALNLPPGKHITPEQKEINPFSFYFGDINLPNLYDIAQKNRPDIIETELLLKEAKNQYKSAVSDLLPTAYLSSYVRGIGPNMNDLQNTKQGMISLNIDLLRYLGVYSFSNIQEAKAKLNIVILQKEKQLNDIYESITKAYNDYFLNVKKLDVARKKIDTARQAYDISMSRLETGVGINLEVLKSQTDLVKAQSDYQSAIMNNNMSQLRLLYEIGLLTPETLEKFFDGEKPLERFIAVKNMQGTKSTLQKITKENKRKLPEIKFKIY